MWWGGLRGAVGFSLAMVLKEEMWYRYQSSSCHPSYIISIYHSSSLKIYDCGCSSTNFGAIQNQNASGFIKNHPIPYINADEPALNWHQAKGRGFIHLLF